MAALGRTERQEMGVQKWVDNKMKGSLVYCTGFGKTRTAMMAMKRFLSKNPGRTILVVVPTDYLKLKWIQDLAENNIKATVLVINTVCKNEYKYDMLVLDECHQYASDLFGQVFHRVHYKVIMGLTATMERLDGKDTYIKKYCPVLDEIKIPEALANDWLSPYREYKVLVEVENLEEYLTLNQEFYEHFAFFHRDFHTALNCFSDWKFRAKYVKDNYKVNSFDPDNEDLQKQFNRQVMAHAAGFNRALQARKQFIYKHPKKIELTNLILEHRQDKKCITFSATIDIAEKIEYGMVLHSKQTKKKRACVLDDFLPLKEGVLNTSRALDVGADIPGLSVAVILSNSSSPTQKTQRIGRVIRRAENKKAEVFTLVLRGTVEEGWFDRSNAGREYITISDSELINVLTGGDYIPKKNRESKMTFTF